MKLEANNISFCYQHRGKQILRQLNLSVESRERVGLSAPSGRGKTTLCRILAGYEKPDSGSVLLDGKPLTSYKGYCPVQMIWQHPEFTINPRIHMRKVLEDGDHIEGRIVDGLGIDPAWLDRYPGELSGGELQRFCIARALGAGTRFILADEISTMLDLITQSQIWNFMIEEVERRQIGLLAVSHSMPLLERVCTRLQVLS